MKKPSKEPLLREGDHQEVLPVSTARVPASPGDGDAPYDDPDPKYDANRRGPAKK